MLFQRVYTIFSMFGFVFFRPAACYTLMAPNVYNQSPLINAREWSNIVPYPFRAYQSSVPLQYYRRYFGDPYFNPNLLQTPEYIFTHDPYSSVLDDSDYYSNFMYYIPTSRRMMYYDQSIEDPMNDIQDYDEEIPEEENISKSQRAWWLAKNVGPNEDIDFEKLNQIDDLFRGKTQKQNEVKKPNTKSRYVGIDGFGRKKEKELVYGNYRKNPRHEEQQIWGHIVPDRSTYEDEDVKELKSLLNNPTKEERRIHYGNSDLTDWASGNVKRNVQPMEVPYMNRNSSVKEKFILALKPTKIIRPVSSYEKADQNDISENAVENNKWRNTVFEEPSVFDTIKKLLALEDEVSQTMNVDKRKICSSLKCKMEATSNPLKTFINHEITTMRQFPILENSETRTTPETTTKIIKNGRTSTTSDKISLKKKLYITDEDSLDEELNALRHRTS